MEFLAELGLFLAKAVIIVVAVVAIIGAIARAASRGRETVGRQGKLAVERLNKRYKRTARQLDRALMPKGQRKKALKAAKAEDKSESKGTLAKPDTRLFVLDFDGDVKASQVASLREEVTAILQVAKTGDEVLLKLKSGGGYVHSYGLATSQLVRLREAGVHLTIAVDTIAASGGYMMACVADKLVAAPFAVIGSIGVVAGIPNIHRLLKKKDIDIEYHTAGDYKRTLTLIGENTDEGRAKFIEQLEGTHALFKDHIARYRPQLDMATVATGEHWYGSEALELGLIDAVGTSDDLLMAARKDHELVRLRHRFRRPLAERLSGAAAQGVERAVSALWGRAQESRLP